MSENLFEKGEGGWGRGPAWEGEEPHHTPIRSASSGPQAAPSSARPPPLTRSPPISPPSFSFPAAVPVAVLGMAQLCKLSMACCLLSEVPDALGTVNTLK
jgi:hypothetical protein